MSIPCPECGYPLTGSETACPECGYPVENQSANRTASQESIAPNTYSPIQPTYVASGGKNDWAQYFYECGVIGWEAFKKYCVFTGRSSRREFWSLWLLSLMIISLTYGIGVIICILPMLGVSIRRMHDINKSGWWSICPIACFFLFFKRSDEGANRYGEPNPAKNLL